MHKPDDTNSIDLESAGRQHLESIQRAERGYRDPEYRPKTVPNFEPLKADIKLVSFYLPQFHRIPENDAWWGAGFTEWSNVTRAVAQYPGHYQPRLPADLGFYDLSTEQPLREQIALARNYGISAFCFHYYWFNGRRVLERPLDLFHQAKDIDFQFCLCWANENWTRRWDGLDQEVLLGQQHSPESDQRFIEDAIRYLKDPRYLRIDGRPLLIVYRPGLMPDTAEVLANWRKIARRELGSDLFLAAVMGFGLTDPTSLGFDCGIQFPPHGSDQPQVTDRIKPFSPDFSGLVFDYSSCVTRIQQLLETDVPVMPAVMPGWDNTARRGSAGMSFVGVNPRAYADWLSEAAFYAAKNPVAGASCVFINAWNEWAEGAHLEPDQKYGHAFLRATVEALRPYSPTPATVSAIAPIKSHVPDDRTAKSGRTGRTATVIHAFYADVLKDLLIQLDTQGEDVFISVVDDKTSEILPIIEALAPRAEVHVFPNIGRDIRPFLFFLCRLRTLGYQSVIKLHTKKTIHRPDGAAWLGALVAPLIALAKAGNLQAMLDAHPDIGIIVAGDNLLDGASYMGGSANIAWLKRLCRELKIDDIPEAFSFAAGTMFAARLICFDRLLDCPAIASLFEEEQGRLDGTLAHALERMMGLLAAVEHKTIVGASMVDGRVLLDIEENRTNHEFRFAEPHIGMKKNMTLRELGLF